MKAWNEGDADQSGLLSARNKDLLNDRIEMEGDQMRDWIRQQPLHRHLHKAALPPLLNDVVVAELASKFLKYIDL